MPTSTGPQMPAGQHSMSPDAIPTNPMDQLKDIHLPESISWWPLAPGWWMLAIAITVVIWLTVRQFLRHRRRHHYRKSAMQELTALPLSNDYGQHVVLLLRRTALAARLHHESTDNVAIDKGAGEFLTSLNITLQQPCFDESLCQQLNVMAYQANPAPLSDDDQSRLLQAAKKWIKKHKTNRPVKQPIRRGNHAGQQ